MALFTFTATRGTNLPCTDITETLPKAICKHTQLEYLCNKTSEGYFLKPTFRNIPYRNSFVPEIDITVSQNGSQTVLRMQGQPVPFVRVFMVFWFGFAFLMECLLLALMFTSGVDNIFPIFIPAILIAFGYFLCKIATKRTFLSVVKAIQKELP